jgi:hypothetical protein
VAADAAGGGGFLSRVHSPSGSGWARHPPFLNRDDLPQGCRRRTNAGATDPACGLSTRQHLLGVVIDAIARQDGHFPHREMGRAAQDATRHRHVIGRALPRRALIDYEVLWLIGTIEW